MARRRPTPAKASKKLRSQKPSEHPRYRVESLETRRMLVVLHGGDVFEFFAEANHMERVTVTGNTTVELIGSIIDPTAGLFPGATVPLDGMDGVVFRGPDSGTVGLGLPPAALPNGGGGGGGAGQTPIENIWAIYVTQSDVNSGIAISGVPGLDQSPRPMQPYTGSETLLVANANGGPNISVSVAGTGNVYIGARLTPPQGNNSGSNTNFPTNRPVVDQEPIPAGVAQTISPSITDIGPGLTVTPGNNLGTFLLGGTLTGTVNVHGAVNLFYAGWIVTGNAAGEPAVGSISNPNNFNIDGDIHTLITNGPIGTNTDSTGLADLGAPNYMSGTDIQIGGKAGEVRSLDSIVANVNVHHNAGAPTLDGTPYVGLDLRGGSGFDPWDSVIFGADPLINDTLARGAQFLGTVDNSGTVSVVGRVQELLPEAKALDYYAVPLMAGQTISVSITSPDLISSVGILSVGVFDAEQRLIATDNSNVDPSQTVGEPFQVTAKTPGVYYFAVTTQGNTTFSTAFEQTNGFNYQLTIGNVGDLAIGGIAAAVNILDEGGTTNAQSSSSVVSGFHVGNGDLGAVYAGNLIISDDPGQTLALEGFTNVGVAPTTVAVDNGNLRAVQAASIGNGIAAGSQDAQGNQTGAQYGEGANCYVPNGSVGLLQAFGTSNQTGQGGTSILMWNQVILTSVAGTGALPELTSSQAASLAIGGDYQMVQAFNLFAGDLVAKGNIGTVRANSMDTNPPSYFQVNATDDPNRHGIIDLIDVATQLGTLDAGGPAITTGPGGNVRYIHVQPSSLSVQTTPLVFRDRAFGGGAPESTLFQPGEAATITDDSGAIVRMTPENAADQLSVTTYPIRGSGGSAIVYVEITNAPNAGPEPASHAAAEGVTISSTSGTAEIGSIVVDGTGTAVAIPTTTTTTTSGGTTTTTTTSTSGSSTTTTTGSGGKFPGAGSPGGAPSAATQAGSQAFTLPNVPTAPALPATLTQPMDLSISGPGKVDVYEITGPTLGTDGSLNTGFANISSITNTSGGEIVNIHASSIGTLDSTGAVGAAVEHNTASVVEGNFRVHHNTEDGTSGAPYSYPLYLVSSLVRVTGLIGSFTASGGVGNAYVGRITNIGPTLDPIPAAFTPPLAIPVASPYVTSLASGVGSLSGPVIGAFVSNGAIDKVDIRGIGWYGSGATYSEGIFSAGQIGPVTDSGDIRGIITSAVGITSVTVNNGSVIDGVIGSLARFDFAENDALGVTIPDTLSPFTKPTLDIGSVTVNGTGGLIGSLIIGDHMGTISTSDSGFGWFDNSLRLLGDGTIFSLSIGGFGFRGGYIQGGATITKITARGDGSTLSVANFQKNIRQSENGAEFDAATGRPINFMDDIDVFLGTTASTPVIAGVTDTGVIEDLLVAGSRDVTSITAWSIRGRQLSTVPGVLLSVTQISESVFNVANMIGNLNVVGPIDGLELTTGRTTKYQFGGNVMNLSMTVAGPIGALIFNSSLLGSSTIAAIGPSGKIGSLLVHGSFSGTISATRSIGTITILGSISGTIKAQSLGTLKFTGGLGNGALQINANVGTIWSTGDFGVPGNTLTINGNLKVLRVGRNLNTGITVGKNLGKLLVAGSILSAANVNVANTITLLQVGGDVQAGAIIKAHIIKRRLIRGQLLGTITTA